MLSSIHQSAGGTGESGEGAGAGAVAGAGVKAGAGAKIGARSAEVGSSRAASSAAEICITQGALTLCHI